MSSSVLTVVTEEREAAILARLGYRVARALEKRLVVLCLRRAEEEGEVVVVEPGATPSAEAEPSVAAVLADLAREERPVPPELLPEPATGETDPLAGRPVLPEPPVEVRNLATSAPLRAVLSQIREVDADHLIVAKHERRKRSGASLARKLFTASPAQTLVVRFSDQAGGDKDGPAAGERTGDDRLDRVLVPIGEGPDTRVALRLGDRLTRVAGGRLTALFVEPTAGELATEVGERVLSREMAAAGVAPDNRVEARVVLADEPLAGIEQVAREGYDLLLIGASGVGTLRRQLFGSVPASLLAAGEGLTVAVVRGRWTLRDRIGARIGRWLDLTVPQLERDDRIRLYENLESGSRWSFDFMALISLSTAIATLGLLQSSTAVVIGAMLVAPLMTPILGAGLALVQGNLPLLLRAAQAIALGYLMALAVGVGGGFLIPLESLTPELLARGGPTLLDMGVGFFAGIAAAHALSRPNLSAALPGVAIAAALVPPIATTGVSIAQGADANARGSLLLFGTNVIAIILGAALTFYAAGVRGRSGASASQAWVRWAFGGLLVGLAVLAVPLVDGMRDGGADRRALEQTLAAHLAASEAGVLESVSEHPEGDRTVIELVVRAPAPLAEGLAGELAGLVADARPDQPAVRVRTEISIDVDR